MEHGGARAYAVHTSTQLLLHAPSSFPLSSAASAVAAAIHFVLTAPFHFALPSVGFAVSQLQARKIISLIWRQALVSGRAAIAVVQAVHAAAEARPCCMLCSHQPATAATKACMSASSPTSAMQHVHQATARWRTQPVQVAALHVQRAWLAISAESGSLRCRLPNMPATPQSAARAGMAHA